MDRVARDAMGDEVKARQGRGADVEQPVRGHLLSQVVFVY